MIKPHPLIAFRTTTEKKDKIEAMAETNGETISQIVDELLQKGCIDFENAYNAGYDSGFEEGKRFGRDESKKELGIKIPCPLCGKDDIYLTPGDAWHKLIIDLVKQYGWGHMACYEKEKSK